MPPRPPGEFKFKLKLDVTSTRRAIAEPAGGRPFASTETVHMTTFATTPNRQISTYLYIRVEHKAAWRFSFTYNTQNVHTRARTH